MDEISTRFTHGYQQNIIISISISKVSTVYDESENLTNHASSTSTARPEIFENCDKSCIYNI